MKLIQALIRPDKLDDLKTALEEAGVASLTVIEVRYRGPEKRELLAFRGFLQTPDYASKIEIEMVVKDDDVDLVVGTILRSARTGVPGDGHVSVFDVEHRYAIHDGRRDAC